MVHSLIIEPVDLSTCRQNFTNCCEIIVVSIICKHMAMNSGPRNTVVGAGGGGRAEGGTMPPPSDMAGDRRTEDRQNTSGLYSIPPCIDGAMIETLPVK